ncbi:cysteine hydrolase family protein [Rhodopseudomonas palustris]|uniref:Cysteine hydrolase n=1 Tax=Rhodopseudomonas palustris TaxID=1076 RepID=A0A418VH02_RHOPL|nr:cysteine hydrolase family protein [Rhodopseudomonas palustris]RJF75408.1 cysteine hydrolase [Rhodopseudomonas palustris]
MTRALLIVDVQNDYFPGGALELTGMIEAADNCRRLLQHFRWARAPVVHVRHQAPAELGALVVHTSGAQIHASLRPTAGEAVIAKTSPNAFRGTWLHPLLSRAGIAELVICGAMTQTCIDSTARAAFDLGYAVTVAADACAARGLRWNGVQFPAAQVQAVILAALQTPFAQLPSTAELIAESSRRAANA